MSAPEGKEYLLASYQESQDGDDSRFYQPSHAQSIFFHIKERRLYILIFSLSVSFLMNGLLLAAYHQAKLQISLCPSEYTGLGLTTKQIYMQSTEYTDSNRTISDAAWEAIDTTPNMISLDKEYSRKHNLADSVPFPWDQSKGLYVVKAFHQIHCLKNIRHAFTAALDPEWKPFPHIPAEHIYHCLDTLRQDIMCQADDTPMPSTPKRHTIGEGQERKCRDWNALIEWTQNPKRETCFKMISDYRRMHTLEQFAFCKEGSQYKEVMEEYFKDHGHRNLFLDEDEGADPW